MHVPKLFASPHPMYSTRREFLWRVGNGFGMLALAGLMDQQGLSTIRTMDLRMCISRVKCLQTLVRRVALRCALRFRC